MEANKKETEGDMKKMKGNIRKMKVNGKETKRNLNQVRKSVKEGKEKYGTNRTRESLEGSKGYHLSTATRALMIGVAVIIVCIVCSLALYMSKQGKTAINSGTSQYNKMLEDYQDLDKSMYDGLMVSGQEVVALIKKWNAQGDEVAVRVKTKASNYVFYNNYYDGLSGNETEGEGENSNTGTPENGKKFVKQITEKKDEDNYINPQADFLGSVWKNENGVIVCVDFVQQ